MTIRPTTHWHGNTIARGPVGPCCDRREHNDTNTTTTRFCTDPDVDRLRDLITQGVDQVEASRLIWGPPTPATIRHRVRAEFQAAFPWLRLPKEVA